jgi:lipoprotein-anchoring transpeptidase ErfK/SrfK
MKLSMNRRIFLLGAPLLLGACTRGMPDLSLALPGLVMGNYGAFEDHGFMVAAVDTSRISSVFLRQRVGYDGPERPGTIVVDPGNHFLYLVEDDGSAIRYGVGVGREGFAWHGIAAVRRKAVWPTWTPPVEMQRRQPEAAQYAGGMPGGPGNPLGARALYLYQGGRDTMYRIHGTNEPDTIGQAVSSGCIRLLNADVIDLYNRVRIGAPVNVI